MKPAAAQRISGTPGKRRSAISAIASVPTVDSRTMPFGRALSPRAAMMRRLRKASGRNHSQMPRPMKNSAFARISAAGALSIAIRASTMVPATQVQMAKLPTGERVCAARRPLASERRIMAAITVQTTASAMASGAVAAAPKSGIRRGAENAARHHDRAGSGRRPIADRAFFHGSRSRSEPPPRQGKRRDAANIHRAGSPRRRQRRPAVSILMRWGTPLRYRMFPRTSVTRKKGKAMRVSMIAVASALALFAGGALAQSNTTPSGGMTATPGTTAPKSTAPGSTAGAPAATPRAPAPDPMTMEDVSQIKGSSVYGSDDKKIGDVSTVLMKPGTKTIDRLVVSSGGVLGIGGRQVALPVD